MGILKTQDKVIRSAITAVLASLSATTWAGALYFPEMSSASESSYAGATGVYIEANFKPNRDTTTVDGKDGSVNKRIVPAGAFAYVRPMSDRLWLGFSVHNYFGLAIDWKDDWVGRYSSVNVTVLAPQFQPSVGYKVNDWLSAGAGAECKYKPKWELTGGFSLDSSMSTDRTRPIVIPLGTMYRYAVGLKHNIRDDLIVGGGFS